MARTQIDGYGQIQDLTITNLQVDTTAGINLTKTDLNAGGERITNGSDAIDDGDFVIYSQLQAVASSARIWKEVLLHPDQLVDGTNGGVAAAQVLQMDTNLASGDTITLNDGSTTENYVAGTNFAIGGNINATIANIAAAIEGSSTIASASVVAEPDLESIDPSNDIIVLSELVIGSTIRVYGNAGAAAKLNILDPTMDNLYEGVESHLVSLPSSDPSALNFGLSYVNSSLVPNQTHSTRSNDSTYLWDNDGETWIATNVGSIPLASKTVFGKVRIDDGIAVTSGVISVQAKTNEGLGVDVNGVYVDYDGSTIGISTGNQLEAKPISIVGDGGTPTNLSCGGTLTFDGDATQGVSTTISAGPNVAITVQDAGYTGTKGVADFDSNHFSVTTGTVSIAANAIDDTLIDWGTSAGQVNAADVPIIDATSYFVATNVEGALEELYLDIQASGQAFTTMAMPNGTNPVATGPADTLTFTETGDITITGTAGTDTINFAVGPFTANNGVQRVGDNFSADLVTAGGLDISGNSLYVVIDNDTLTKDSTTGALEIAVDGVSDIHIDWGTGPGQVNAADVPIIDATSYFVSTVVEGALDELYEAIQASGQAFTTMAVPNGTNPVATGPADTLTWTNSGEVTITGTAGTDTIDISVGPFTANNGVQRIGDVFSADIVTGGGLDISGNSLYVVIDNDSLTKDSTTGALEIAVDGVDDTHINWGTGPGQVNAADVPVIDATSYFVATNVEGVLEELYQDIQASGQAFTTMVVPNGTNPVATGAQDNLNWTETGDITITGTAGTDTMNLTVGPFTANNGVQRIGDVFSVDILAAGGLDLLGNELYVVVDNDSLTRDSTTGALEIAIDGVNSTHIDWGSGADQVDATEVPLDSGGTWTGSATNVQDALEELETDLANATDLGQGEILYGDGTSTLKAQMVVREQANEAPDGARTQFTFDFSPIIGTEHLYLSGLLMNEGASDDYTISGSTITFNYAPKTKDTVFMSYLAY